MTSFFRSVEDRDIILPSAAAAVLIQEYTDEEKTT